MKFMRFFVLVLMLVSMCGCAKMVKQRPIMKPVINIDTTYPTVSSKDVLDIILQTCDQRKWHIDSYNEKFVDASITVRGKHYVAVRIPYSKTKLEIEYRDSSNMMYDDKEDPKIHRAYNNWVTNLIKDMHVNFTKLCNSRLVK